MKNSVKSFFFIFLIIILLCIGYVIWKVTLSPQAIQSRKNEKNSKKIEVGYSKKELISIMGSPDQILTDLGSTISDTIYFYQPGFAAASGIDFYIENDTVIFIGKNE